MKLKSKVEKFLFSLNCLIGITIALNYTFQIDLSNIQPHYEEWLALLFLLAFTSLLCGTPLFCLSMAVISLTSSVKKPYLEESVQFVIRSCFDAIGVPTAYSMGLYVLGLTQSFFSFICF